METEIKKITVDDLIKAVENAKKTKKDYSFDKHITRKYMPYMEKDALVKSIVKSTSYEKVGDIEMYKRRTSSMVFIFTMKLVEAYTNIELDIQNIHIEYDKLMETGIMNSLMNVIPKEEITMLRGMLDMERDDLEENTRSLVSFLETKVEAFEMAMKKLNEALDSSELKALINNGENK